MFHKLQRNHKCNFIKISRLVPKICKNLTVYKVSKFTLLLLQSSFTHTNKDQVRTRVNKTFSSSILLNRDFKQK